MFNNKSLQSVAAAAAQIKTTVEQVAVNEKSVEGAVVSIMTQPTKIQEEVQVLKEGWDDMLADVKKRSGPQPSGGSGVKQGSRYGGGKQTSKPEQEETAEEKPKTKTKRKFSEMVNTYQESGLKSLSEMVTKKETEIEVIDADLINGADQVTVGEETIDEALKGNQHKIDKNKNNKIDAHDFKLLRKEEQELEERSLTSGEKAEVEKNVKGMKKNIAGFKARYGDDAKSVMYATATKQAKKD